MIALRSHRSPPDQLCPVVSETIGELAGLGRAVACSAGRNGLALGGGRGFPLA